MRINGSNPKSESTMFKKKKKEKKPASSHAGIWTCNPASSSAKNKPACNWATRPLRKDPLKLIALRPSNIFLCHSQCLNFVEVFYHEFKYTFEEKWLKRVFQAISHYLRVHLLSGFITAARWTNSSSSLLSLKFRFSFRRWIKIFHGKDFEPLSNQALLYLQPAVI